MNNIEQIQKWKEKHINLNMEYFNSAGRDHVKVSLDPPSPQMRAEMLRALIEIYRSWEISLKEMGEPYYLALRLYEPRFDASILIAAKGRFLDMYKKGLNPSELIPFPSQYADIMAGLPGWQRGRDEVLYNNEDDYLVLSSHLDKIPGIENIPRYRIDHEDVKLLRDGVHYEYIVYLGDMWVVESWGNGGWWRRGTAMGDKIVKDITKFLFTSLGIPYKTLNDKLCDAVISGDKAKIIKLLDKGANINEMSSAGKLPLNLAVVSDSLDMVEFLIAQGADVNLTDNTNTFQLGIAVSNNNMDMVRLLLSHGAIHDIFIWDDDRSSGMIGETPLHIAVEHGNKEMLELLIEYRADVNAGNNYGSTPLHYAALFGKKDIAKLLLSHGADPNISDNRGVYPLGIASYHEDMDMIRLLLSYRADTGILVWDGEKTDDILTEMPLHIAVQKGNTEMVELLLRHDAQVDVVNSEGETPLHVAALFGKKDIAKLLLAKGANVNARDERGHTPLFDAAFDGNGDMVELLGADLNAKSDFGETPLHRAVNHGDADTLLLLLSRGADPNLGDNEGETPLHVALLKLEHPGSIAALLLAHGANPNARNDAGSIPLHYVPDTDTIDLLISHGAKINTQNKFGDTPLHLAVSNGEKEQVASLLSHGAEEYIKDYDGDTPLHIAVYDGNIEIAKLLLAQGANPNGSYPNRDSFLHRAAKTGNREMVKLLLAYNADPNTQNWQRETPVMVTDDEEIKKLLKKN